MVSRPFNCPSRSPDTFNFQAISVSSRIGETATTAASSTRLARATQCSSGA